MKETLDSDRVNYLIWRYLVESDYSQTAARLQKEWNIPDPQQLPFAPHVTNHALVAVLNRGLLFNVQERELAQPSHDADARPATGFFGPLTPTSPPAAVEEELENGKKRQIDNDPAQNQSEPSGKRPRLSNGDYENGFAATPMDVDDDQNGDEHAYPSPEQVPSPIVATTGPEQGTQVDKVLELAPETIFLELSDDPSTKNSILLQCEFHPRDPSILAAAGTDALARMWSLSRISPDTGSDSPGTTQAPHQNLLSDGASPNTTVTGLSWASDGKSIVVASEPIEDGSARIEFWQDDGAQLASFNGFESPVILLRWNLSNTLCLALSPLDDGKSTVITVMHPSRDMAIKYTIPDHALLDQPLDAAWITDDEFVVCGGNILQGFQCVETSISPMKKYETRQGESLSKITYDPLCKLLATASESGTIEVWDEHGNRRSFNAHQGIITSLVWQPTQTHISDDSERLLASAGEDGAISIWNVRSPDTKSRSSMTMESAVVALAYTPDGAFIAGCTNERILIWKSDEVSVPRAIWTRGDESGWRSPQSHDSASATDESEDHFSLCWDAHGQKLAYGVNSRLAVINFRR